MSLPPPRPAALFRAAVAAAAALALAAAPAAAQDTTAVTVLRSDTVDHVFPVRDSVFRRVFDIDPVVAAGVFGAYPSELEDAYGGRVPVKVTLAGADSTGRVRFEGRPRLRVAVEARLPRPGDYRGNITFVAGNRRTTRFYRVAWGAVAAAPLEVGSPGAVAKQLTGLSDRVDIRLTVHDSTRLPVAIYPPALVSLTRMGIGGTDSTRVQGGAGAVATCGDSAVKGRGRTFSVDANATLDCTLSLQGMTEPGRYTATVRVAGPGIPAATIPVNVYLKNAWFGAAVAIGLGALISELLRQYLQNGRPRLVLLRDLRRLLERIDAAAARPAVTPAEKEVLAELRSRLAAIADQREPEKDAKARPTLEAVEDRLDLLPAWAALRARVDRLETGALREEADEKLDAVHEWLLAKESTEAEDKQAYADLRAVPEAIEEARKKQLLAAIDAFTAAVARERDARAGDEELLAVLDAEVKARAEAARKEAEAGRPTAAAEGLEKARGAYARLLARDLEGRLGPYDRPEWISPEAWSSTVARVREALGHALFAETAEEAIEAYEAARAAFLRAPAEALRAAVRAERMDPAVPKELRDALGPLDGALAEVLVLVGRGQLPEATTALERAQADYARIQAEHASPPRDDDARGDLMGEEDEEEAAEPTATRAAAPGVELPPGVPGGTGLLDLFGFSGAVARRRTAAGLDEEIRRRDLMVSAAMGVVAVLLGLSLLWVDAPTWGSFKDVVAAFLWGLGLHKVGTDAFGGISALTANYAKAPAEQA